MSLITVDCYGPMCDATYVKGKPIPDGQVISVSTEDVKYLFEELGNTPDRKLILVSSYSDYSIYYQQEAPVNRDLIKCFHGIDFAKIESQDLYARVELKAANYDDCNPWDRYSVKIDRHTINTFPKIPDNIVAWFCTNANINEPQVHFLPFGMNNEGHGKDIIESYYKKNTEKMGVYSNFQINSYNRLHLKDWMKALYRDTKNWKWLTHVDTPNRQIEQFYEELAVHALCISPNSNGIDCYRNYEALVVGSIPLVEQSRWSKSAIAAGFNFVAINYAQLSGDLVGKILQSVNWSWNTDLLTQEYWKEKINGARSLL
jgi:hypothetical protein